MEWSGEILVTVPRHLLYDNIHDFKRAAVLVESEMRRHDIRYDSDEAVKVSTAARLCTGAAA